MLAPLVHVLVRWKVPSGRAGGGEAGRSALNQRRGGWVAPNTYGDPCGQAYAGRQDCPPDLEPSTRWISSLCHECEQVGLAVSIDTLSSRPPSACPHRPPVFLCGHMQRDDALGDQQRGPHHAGPGRRVRRRAAPAAHAGSGPNARNFSVGRGHSAAGRGVLGLRPRTQPREGGRSRGGARWLSQRRPLGAVLAPFGAGLGVPGCGPANFPDSAPTPARRIAWIQGFGRLHSAHPWVRWVTGFMV